MTTRSRHVVPMADGTPYLGPVRPRHVVPMADGTPYLEPDMLETFATVTAAWLEAQQDVLTITGQTRPTAAAPVTAAGPFDAYDAWAGDLSEIHAFLTAHPAF